MENESKTKAVLYSLLVMILGGVVWGIVYSLGFFSAWVSIIFAALATIVYKKYKAGKVGMFFYVLLASCIINYAAIIIATTIVFLKIYPTVPVMEVIKACVKVSFGEGASDTIYCLVFTILGCVLGFVGRLRKVKNDKQNNAQVATIENTPEPIVNTVEQIDSNEQMYESIKVTASRIIDEYKQDKSKENMLKRVDKAKSSLIPMLTEEEKAYIKKCATDNILIDVDVNVNKVVLQLLK